MGPLLFFILGRVVYDCGVLSKLCPTAYDGACPTGLGYLGRKAELSMKRFTVCDSAARNPIKLWGVKTVLYTVFGKPAQRYLTKHF
jgi:hypothetical protein